MLFQKYPFPMIFMDATILLYYETGTNDEMVNSCSTCLSLKYVDSSRSS